MANPIIKELSGDIQNLASTYKTVAASKQDILKAHAASKNGAVFTADTDKTWKFSEFQSEGKQVQVDASKLTEKEKAFFTNYQVVCDNYIKQITVVYQNKNNDAKKKGAKQPHNLPITITGKMLADAALKTYVKYNDISKVVPVKTMLAQLQGESAFGTQTPRETSKISPFNVGVYDSKDADYLKNVESKQQGIEMYFDVMAEDYLSKNSAESLSKNFVNENNARYASNKNYETELIQPIQNSVEKRSANANIKISSTEGLTTSQGTSKPATNNTTTPAKPATPAATGSTLTGSVGVKGDNKPADVKTVKTLLNKKNNAGLDTANSNVAEKTIAAIKAFQTKNKLTVDGIIGKNGETWKALNGGTTATPAPAATTSKLSGSVGSKGDNKLADVKTVKTLLNKKISAGLDTANPNVLEKTIAAIKAFQKKSGLTQTGLINVESSTWRALSGTVTVTPTPTPAPTPAPTTGKALSANVGPNQPNVAADVKTVKELLNKKNNAGLDTANPNVLEKTIAAIKAFQKKSKLSETGIVEKDGATLKALYAAANAPTPTPAPNTSTGQGNLDNVKLHGKVYGAETETEKKLLEFTKSLNGIKVEVSKGNIVYVRPPYHINAFGYEKKAAKRTKAINDAATATKVSKIGKATPVELSAFLELCIQKNIIPVKERTATGLRNFLDTYGFSTDCSGLANQGINFLLDGNLEFNSKTDAVNLNNVGTSSMMGGNFKKLAKPSALKAGDVMVKNGHVRLVIDVDSDGKGGIEFTTTESTAGTGPEGGTGVRQVRWKFPNSGAFSDLKIMSYKTEQFVNADAADRGYIYTRHKKLDNIPA